VTTHCVRAEEIKLKYDFIISRAVAHMDTFTRWTRGKIKSHSVHEIQNGIFYLKGGDLTEELKAFPKAKIYDLSDHFKEEFFRTKKVVYLKR